MLPFVLFFAPLAATVVDIEFDAPADCAGAETFYESLRSRTDRIRKARPGEPGLVLRVRLARAGSKVVGELRIADGQGETARRVVGERCDQVLDALALSTVIALYRLVDEPEPPPQAPPAAPAPAPAPPVAERAARPAAPARAAWGLAVGARALAAEAVMPYVSAGGEVLVRFARSENGPAFDLAVLHAQNAWLSGGGVAIGWTAFTLSACHGGWSLAGGFRIQPCGSLAGGWLDATDEALDHPASVRRSWWGVGGRLRASVGVGRGYALELEGGAIVPLLRRRFVANSPDRSLGETPILSALGAVGLTYRF